MGMMGPIIITLVSGTYASVSSKILYNWRVEGIDGPNTFNKAYFLTLMMFFGEALCLFYKLIVDWQAARHKFRVKNDLEKPLIDTPLEGDGAASGNKPHILVFCLLSVFDLTATLLSGIGLNWVTASANQMLRGSTIFFTGIFRIVIFRESLPLKKWIGISIVMAGLILVGLTGMIRPDSSGGTNATAAQALGGILLVLAGSAINSLQNVFEERLLKGTTVDALEVVGWEGIFGSVLSIFIMLPIAQNVSGPDVGCAENSRDTLMQLTGSAGMTITVLGYSVSLALMNFYSQLLSKYLSAVHRMLISTLRVVLVWIINLYIFYGFPYGENYGENFDVYSLLQLTGFFMLLGGTVVYMQNPEEKKVETLSTSDSQDIQNSKI